MSESTDSQSPPQAATEAAEWFIDLQGATVTHERRQAFADWLRRSPVHIEEILQLTALHGDLARLSEVKSLDVAQALARFQGLPAADNIIVLNTKGLLAALSHEETCRAATNTQRGWILWGALRRRVGRGKRVAVVAAVAVFSVISVWLSASMLDVMSRRHYRTAVGEQRLLTLADGSEIRLNALSDLSTMVGKSVRELQLEDGEALFRVAKDPAHPFRVHTPQATIEAKGTQFDVRVSSGKTIVSLLEGRVLVMSGGTGAGSNAITLDPGEQVAIANRAVGAPKPQKVNLKIATAWTEHRLVFEDAPLSDVIAEFNRYSRQRFVINDPALGDVHITASFDSNSTQTFADSLSVAGHLRVTRQSSGVWLIEPN